MFKAHLDLSKSYEGLKKFKQYLDFVVGNILNTVNCREDDIAKNLWIIDTIEEALRIIKQRPASVMNPQK